MTTIPSQISISSFSSSQYAQDFQDLQKQSSLVSDNKQQPSKRSKLLIKNKQQETQLLKRSKLLIKSNNNQQKQLLKKSKLLIHSNKQPLSQTNSKIKNNKITNSNKPNSQQTNSLKDIHKKVSEIIHKKSIIDQEVLSNQEQQIYENDFEIPVPNQFEDGSMIKSQLQNQKYDESFEEEIVEESQEVVSEIIESNDPQLEKFKRNKNKTQRKQINSNSKQKDNSINKPKEKSGFLKNKDKDVKNKPKNVQQKQKIERKNSKAKLNKQKLQNNYVQKHISKAVIAPASNGFTPSGLSSEQIQKYYANKLKKQQEQQANAKQKKIDSQEAKAQQKQRRKQIDAKMKQMAREKNKQIQKRQKQAKEKEQAQKRYQRGASRAKQKKHVPQKDQNKISIQDDFAQRVNHGDKAVANKPSSAQIPQPSVANTDLSVINRIKNNLAKKKQFDKKVQEDVVNIFHKLNQKPKYQKHEQIKQQRKKQKQVELQHKKQQFLIQQKQQSTTKQKLLKKQIQQLRSQRYKLQQRIIDEQRIKKRYQEQIKALETQQNIIVLDHNKKKYTSYGLVRNLNKIDKTLNVDQVVNEEHHNVSDQTPVQKFVNFFFKQNYEQSDIFDVLNINDDDILTLKEIEKVSKQLYIPLSDKQLKQVFKILDYDSSGSLSKDQFDYIIGKQLQTKVNLKKILGKIDVQNPIEIQQRILDMRAKIKFMQKFVQQNQSIQDYNYTKLLEKIQKYTNKIQKIKSSNKKDQTHDIMSMRQELKLLQIQKDNEQRIGNIVKEQISNNIKQKSELLKRKIEQQLKCRQKLYQIKNQYQEQQLRYITLEKIIKTKERHLDQGNLKEKEKQAQIRMATEYKNRIVNKKTSSDFKGTDDHMRLLAATLMIQRNYRKRKAMKQYQKLKEDKKASN